MIATVISSLSLFAIISLLKKRSKKKRIAASMASPILLVPSKDGFYYYPASEVPTVRSGIEMLKAIIATFAHRMASAAT